MSSARYIAAPIYSAPTSPGRKNASECLVKERRWFVNMLVGLSIENMTNRYSDIGDSFNDH